MTTLSPSQVSTLSSFFQPATGGGLSDNDFNELILLINESPLFVSEITDYLTYYASHSGSGIEFGTGDTGDFSFTTYQINISATPQLVSSPSDPFSQDDGDTAGKQTTYDVSQITGILAHELGHFEDFSVNDNPANSGIGGPDFVAYGLLSEGVAQYNNLVIAEQIADNSYAASVKTATPHADLIAVQVAGGGYFGTANLAKEKTYATEIGAISPSLDTFAINIATPYVLPFADSTATAFTQFSSLTITYFTSYWLQGEGYAIPASNGLLATDRAAAGDPTFWIPIASNFQILAVGGVIDGISYTTSSLLGLMNPNKFFPIITNNAPQISPQKEAAANPSAMAEDLNTATSSLTASTPFTITINETSSDTNNTVQSMQLTYSPSATLEGDVVLGSINYYAGQNDTGALLETDEDTATISTITLINTSTNIYTRTVYSQPDGQGSVLETDIFYNVQASDTWADIAAKYGMDADALETINNDTPNIGITNAGYFQLQPNNLMVVPISQGMGVPTVNIGVDQILYYDVSDDRWYITSNPGLAGTGPETEIVYSDEGEEGGFQLLASAQAPGISSFSQTPPSWNSSGYETVGNAGAVFVGGSSAGYEWDSQEYDVQPGDTYMSISSLIGTNANILAAINPEAGANPTAGAILREIIAPLPIGGLVGIEGPNFYDTYGLVLPQSSDALLELGDNTVYAVSPHESDIIGPGTRTFYVTDGNGNLIQAFSETTMGAATVIESTSGPWVYDIGNYIFLTNPSGGASSVAYADVLLSGAVAQSAVQTGGAVEITDTTGSGSFTLAAGEVVWTTGAGTDTAAIDAGTISLHFTGSAAQYNLSYSGDQVTITDSQSTRNGVKTLTLAGGATTLVFANTSLALSDTGATETGEGGNDIFTLAGNSATINGGGGTNTVVFSSGMAAPTNAWSIVENAGGQILVSGTSAGYAGTATLTSIQHLIMDGLTYGLVTTPVAGGNTTVGTPGTGMAGKIVVDGAGNDALTFNGTGTSYWHVGGGNDTAILVAGRTEIYFAGASSQYTETYNGINIVTVQTKASGSTDAITLSGGTGELVFASGSSIGLGGGGNGTDTLQYGGSGGAKTLTGTSGDDTLYTGVGNTVNGNGGNDTYLFGTGDGAVTINNGVSSNNMAKGTVDFQGSLTNQSLWFVQSGNNLIADVLGTTNQLTLRNYYASGNTYAQTAEIEASNLKLDTQLTTLIQAMAAYSAGNSAFNPQASGTIMPSSLEPTIASSWHS